jgi:hypothetical protein
VHLPHQAPLYALKLLFCLECLSFSMTFIIALALSALCLSIMLLFFSVPSALTLCATKAAAKLGTEHSRLAL